MAFDKNNPVDVLALKTEVDTDPAAMGYTAGDGDTGKLLGLLNDPINNTTPADGNAPMKAEAFLDAIFDAAISAQDQFKIQLMFEGTSGLDGDLSRFRVKAAALAPGISSAIDTITRPLSRAEILFANDDVNGVKEFVTISSRDWFAARDL